jgi:hypothetical protein
MSKEYDTVIEARRTMKAHIQFLEALLKHLKGHDKNLRTKAVITAWCLHRYFTNSLMKEVEAVLREELAS